ncbi:MAG: tetratricopeptide repeat protein, partial [Bacteroidota bacterium]
MTQSAYAEALKHHQKALRLQIATLGEEYPDVAGSYCNLGFLYRNQGNYTQALAYIEKGLKIFESTLGNKHPYTKRAAGSLRQLQGSAAQQGGYARAIAHYEKALKELPEEAKDTRRSIYRNMGCMYHVSALTARAQGETTRSQEHLQKAKLAFEQGIKALPAVKAGLWTAYSNFLLSTDQLKEAYSYLLKAIKSEDASSGLGYSTLEQATVSPVLQKLVDQKKEISLRSIDYAYYLLIHHYEAFKKLGIELEQPEAAYLEAYQKAIAARAGQQGKEQEDEVAYYLLGSLYQELSNEAAAKEAFEKVKVFATVRRADQQQRVAGDRKENTSIEGTVLQQALANSCDTEAEACLKQQDYKQAQAHYAQALI